MRIMLVIAFAGCLSVLTRSYFLYHPPRMKRFKPQVRQKSDQVNYGMNTRRSANNEDLSLSKVLCHRAVLCIFSHNDAIDR